MTGVERKALAALDRKAAALQKIWLRERDEQQAKQSSANAEVRQRWVVLDSIQGGEVTSAGPDSIPPAEQADRCPIAAGPERRKDHDSRDTSSRPVQTTIA